MTNTIILTVHNKDITIVQILDNLLKTISSVSIKLIIILDGCTDKTYENIKSYLKKTKLKINVEIIFTDDIWETKANNVGLREVTTDYATIIQDDMLIKQKNWDKLLIEKLANNNVFSISGRAAYNYKLKKNKLNIENIIGREYPFSNKNIFGKIVGKLFAIFKPYWLFKYFSLFSVRLINNRGPLVLKINLVRELGFFDEKFAPFELDDVDLCFRAFKKYGLYSSCFPIYYEEINGSKKHNLNSKLISEKSIAKNSALLISKHRDLL